MEETDTECFVTQFFLYFLNKLSTIFLSNYSKDHTHNIW